MSTACLGIARGFRRWGTFVSAKPYTVICFTTVFAAVWAVTFFALYKQEGDSEDLFTPQDSSSFDDKDYVEATYGAYNSRVRAFDHVLRNGRVGVVAGDLYS